MSDGPGIRPLPLTAEYIRGCEATKRRIVIAIRQWSLESGNQPIDMATINRVIEMLNHLDEPVPAEEVH